MCWFHPTFITRQATISGVVIQIVKFMKLNSISLSHLVTGRVLANEGRNCGVLFAIALSLVMSLPLQGCSELHQSFYPTLGDAINSGEITRGWLPDFVPANTHDIRIAYNPSSAKTWCAFQFSPDGSQRLRNHLSSPQMLPPRVRRIEGSGLEWWPDFLRGTLNLAAIQSHGFTVYLVSERDIGENTREVLFAINWLTGRGYFYRTTGG